MLALLAIGFGPLVARLLLDDQLASATTQIVNAFGLADARSVVHLVRLAVRFVLPACIALLVLRFTPLGRCVTFTPLTLVSLALADSLIVLNIVDQLRLFVLSSYSSFRFTGDLAAAVTLVTLGIAGASLVLATAWHRSDSSRRWLIKNGQRWFREA